jgi:hypothetical protein
MPPGVPGCRPKLGHLSGCDSPQLKGRAKGLSLKRTAAKLLIDRHSEDAALNAASRADLLLEEGDVNCARS